MVKKAMPMKKEMPKGMPPKGMPMKGEHMMGGGMPMKDADMKKMMGGKAPAKKKK